jgi:hypothetical protein
MPSSWPSASMPMETGPNFKTHARYWPRNELVLAVAAGERTGKPRRPERAWPELWKYRRQTGSDLMLTTVISKEVGFSTLTSGWPVNRPEHQICWQKTARNIIDSSKRHQVALRS